MKQTQNLKKMVFAPLRGKTFVFASLLLAGLLVCGFSAWAQKTVTGKVTNEQGSPMVGASVQVKGTTTGTSTNNSGNFSISASKGDVLVISNVDYIDREIAVGDNNNYDVRMDLKSGSLEEVVVVGYGTQRKRDVTGAITKVNSEQLLRTASHSVIDQLKGRAAGVNITTTSAVPGGGSQIRIRGNRTMVTNTVNSQLPGSGAAAQQQQLEAATADQADAPLLVVDGIPYSGNLTDISPNDVASLEILKDASATAIYGSRGAGGVILITTKRGSAGKLTFNYDAYYGTTRVMEKLRVLTGQEYAQLKIDALAGVFPTSTTQPWPLSAAEQAALAAGVSTDWQDLIYQSAPMTNHNLNVSGGTDKSRFSMSLGYFLQGGIIPNQNYRRYNIRSTMDHQLSKRIRIGLTTINSVGVQNTPGGTGLPNGNLMRITPLANPYNPDGTLNLQIQTGGTDNFFNPLTLKTRKEAILSRNRRLRTFNSFYGEVDLIKGLKYRLNVGLDYYQDKGDGYAGPGTVVNNSLAQTQSTASIRNTEFWQYTFENLLIYERTIREKHRLGVTAMYSAQKSQSTSSFVSAIGVPFDYMQNTDIYLASTISTTPGANYFWERGLISWMGRVNYSFDNRYSLTATVRRDGASVLSGEKYVTYPAVAVAWNVMNEKFMAGRSFLSNLKLRAGWGIAASQGINPYATLGLLGSSAYNFGQTTAGQQTGYVINSLPNASLKWQSTSQFNFGLDFGAFRNRLTGSIEIYKQKTKDILLPVALPPSNGGGTTFLNLGKTQGSGFELTLNSVNISNKTIRWTTDFNFFFNREKIVELTTPDQKNDVGNGWFVGQPITVIYDFEKIGIWQTGDHGLTTQLSPVQRPGDIRLRDLNGDNRITAEDRKILGNFQPKFEAGIENTVSIKGFDLSIALFARMGMKVVVPYLSSESGGSFFAGYNWFLTGRNNQLKVDYWTPTNPTNKFPQPDATSTPQYSSTLSYVDGSFVKCRNINIGYTLPKSVLDKAKLGINSLRVYGSFVNPFVIYSPFVKEGYGPDPEGNGYGGGVASQNTGQAGTVGRQITVNANNPATRQFIFGVNLNF